VTVRQKGSWRTKSYIKMEKFRNWQKKETTWRKRLQSELFPSRTWIMKVLTIMKLLATLLLLAYSLAVSPLRQKSKGGIQSSPWNAEDANAVTGPNHRAAAYDDETGLNYGCHLTYCWRSCKKGEQIVKGEVGISARTMNGATVILEFVPTPLVARTL